ncbi:MAG: phosphoribosylglycinamide formyltransferase [Frankiaceae bacterium]|nr:phosphoribosylglycinamide formyltransferase [Frankiaceae bacterium]
MPARLVVLASGTGTTLQAIIDAAAGPHVGSAAGPHADSAAGPLIDAAAGPLPARIALVGSDRPQCQALRRAESAGIEAFAEPLPRGADRAARDAWNDRIAARVAAAQPDLVLLAGFMRVLNPAFVRRFRILNTHPSLLPAFPGAHAIRDALNAGVRVSGVTVHWVDEGLDTGRILAQRAVDVVPGDDEDSLRERIQAVEKPLYIDTIRAVLGGLPL